MPVDVLFGVPVPLLFGIVPCGLAGVGAAVVFGLPAVGVSVEGAAAGALGIALLLSIVPVDGVLVLIELPLAAPVLPGLESCC